MVAANAWLDKVAMAAARVVAPIAILISPDSVVDQILCGLALVFLPAALTAALLAALGAPKVPLRELAFHRVEIASWVLCVLEFAAACWLLSDLPVFLIVVWAVPIATSSVGLLLLSVSSKYEFADLCAACSRGDPFQVSLVQLSEKVFNSRPRLARGSSAATRSTALHILAEAASGAHDESAARVKIAALLVEDGCNVNARNALGHTAAGIARYQGCELLLRALVDVHGSEVVLK
jgi:hypothetical protein